MNFGPGLGCAHALYSLEGICLTVPFRKTQKHPEFLVCVAVLVTVPAAHRCDGSCSSDTPGKGFWAEDSVEPTAREVWVQILLGHVLLYNLVPTSVSNPQFSPL